MVRTIKYLPALGRNSTPGAPGSGSRMAVTVTTRQKMPGSFSAIRAAMSFIPTWLCKESKEGNTLHFHRQENGGSPNWPRSRGHEGR